MNRSPEQIEQWKWQVAERNKRSRKLCFFAAVVPPALAAFIHYGPGASWGTACQVDVMLSPLWAWMAYVVMHETP